MRALTINSACVAMAKGNETATGGRVTATAEVVRPSVVNEHCNTLVVGEGRRHLCAPTGIGQCTRSRAFRVSEHSSRAVAIGSRRCTGAIPTEIGRCTAKVQLNLGSNVLSGKSPLCYYARPNVGRRQS